MVLLAAIIGGLMDLAINYVVWLVLLLVGHSIFVRGVEFGERARRMSSPALWIALVVVAMNVVRHLR